MSKDIVIRGNQYLGVPEVDVPLIAGGTAKFIDPSDATLENGGQMLNSVTGYGADGVMITGNIPEKDSSDLTASGATVTVPAGHYAQQASKAVAGGTATAPASVSGTGATVTPGTNTLKLSKQISITPQVNAGYVSEGTPGNAAVELTASVPTKEAETITPGTTDQEVAAGTYLAGKLTIQGDTNLKSSSIVEGVSIFGVAGGAKVPLISQDATTKVLSIS